MTIPPELQTRFVEIERLIAQTIAWPSTLKIDANLEAIRAEVRAIADGLDGLVVSPPPSDPTLVVIRDELRVLADDLRRLLGPPPPPVDPPPPPADYIITPGENIAAIVASRPAGAVFELSAGVHRATAPIVPKSGQTFRGVHS